MTTQVVLYYIYLPITAPPDHIRAKILSRSNVDLTAPPASQTTRIDQEKAKTHY